MNTEEIQKEKLNLIKNKFVHKWDAKNIFISNVWRTFPTIIKKTIFNEVILPAIDEKSREVMLANFSHASLGPNFFMGEGEYIVLNSILLVLQKDEFEKKSGELGEIENKILLSAYSLDVANKSYVLSRELTDVEEKKILLFFDMQAKYIGFEDKLVLSSILEQFDFVPKVDVFYAKMYVDPSHDYFFEHPNEHIPGMMALEALRQFGMACSHIYGNIPLEESRFIINSLAAKFIAFIEFSYPIILMGVVTKKKLNKLGYWTYGNMDLSIIQKNEVVTEANIEASGISERLFERLRETKFDMMVKYRFYPILHSGIDLVDDQSGNAIKAEIVNISTSGFLLRIKKSDDAVAQSASLAFSIRFADFNPIKGTCFRVRDHNETKKDLYANVGFKIKEISETDLYNMRELILKCCKVVETHEVF